MPASLPSRCVVAGLASPSSLLHVCALVPLLLCSLLLAAAAPLAVSEAAAASCPAGTSYQPRSDALTKYVGSGYASGGVYQGWSSALSHDGATLAVGAPMDDQVGAVWVYALNPDTGLYEQQGGKIVGTGMAGASYQGYSVALSADGNTLAVGGPMANSTMGAVWVHTRDLAGQWSQQGSPLVPNDVVGKAQAGMSVSLSADGNTLAVGGNTDNSSAGAVWVYTRGGNGQWTQQGAKLAVSDADAAGHPNVGSSVSLSGDGNTLAVGGIGDNSGVGAVWVFTRSAGTWSQQGSKLVGSGGVPTSGKLQQGEYVTLSSDGRTLAVAGRSDSRNLGAVWVFARNDSGQWLQQGEKLVGSGGGAPNSYQGSTPSLSATGDKLAFGGNGDNAAVGAAWLFVRVDGVWRQQGDKIVNGGAIGEAGQGYSVALSADGVHLEVGGATDNSGVGAVWAGRVEDSCLVCPVGSYCPDPLAPPVACSAGSFCPPGSTSDLPCPAGSYCPLTATEPQLCPAGSWSGRTGLTAATECTPCAAGSYGAAAGQTSAAAACSLCPVNTFGTAAGAANVSACTACPAATYSPSEGATSTFACLADCLLPASLLSADSGISLGNCTAGGSLRAGSVCILELQSGFELIEGSLLLTCGVTQSGTGSAGNTTLNYSPPTATLQWTAAGARQAAPHTGTTGCVYLYLAALLLSLVALVA